VSESKVQWLARALVVLGFALITAGAYLAYAPAGLIVPGVLLFVVGTGALRGGANEATPR
jgi:hypothetical protein